ncbi:glutaminyl-peptide cyclotransferase isoform X2 [Phoenix dactylifera]|uniref:Glutaminyl-peptide cyclotransferase isoform X2 n=1 Tax=Phoenix dactylifera TaxID=42345 RepID=A0A8B8Z9J2_PHODC|nr:glutaminyl-peptide cyclotransferase isoform X2 [Phoenix dactylifera]
MAVGSRRRGKPRRTSADTTMASSPPPRPRTAAATASRHRSFWRRGISIPFVLIFVCVLLLINLAWKLTASIVSSPRFYSFDIVDEFPHDPGAFTQSSVRQVLLQTGKVQSYYAMDGSVFGEGLTLLGERLFQVAWLTKTGFIYDRHNLSKHENFVHQMQDGWGLATDGKVLFGSDGSSTLYQIDPLTLKVTRMVTVRYGDLEIPYVNELEYVSGEVWANIWQTDCIARISQKDGTVLGWILLNELREGLLRSGHTDIDVLNGIAWDEGKNRLFVTGKLWPKLYEIKLRPIRGPLKGSIEDLCPIKT